jgi:arsenate reductase
VEVLTTADCPHATAAVEVVREVLSRLAPEVEPSVRVVRDLDEAVDLHFPGSPTVRINGVDLEGAEVGPAAFACRRYGAEGVPPTWLVEAGVLRALGPKHVLFLCVANSARSQMAEGLARTLAPKGVRVSSAGSEPTRVRPQAVTALAELGIDIDSHRSKGMRDIEGPVDAVITLCAEEVCPAWLGQAWRVHWGLPDPAGVAGTEEEILQAFRDVRDELRRRLGVLFG